MSLVRSTVKMVARRSILGSKNINNNITSIFASKSTSKSTNPLVGQSSIQAQIRQYARVSAKPTALARTRDTPKVTMIPTGKTNDEKVASIKEMLRKAHEYEVHHVDNFIWRVIRDWKLVIEPDVETYNLMLKFFAGQANRTAARNVFDAMLDKHVTPNTESYNHLLATYSKSGTEVSTSMVFSILSEMKRNNVPYDPNTFISALELFCRLAQEDSVKQFLAIIKAQGIKSPLIYVHLLTLSIKLNQPHRVLGTFREAINEGTPLQLEEYRRAFKFLLKEPALFKDLWELAQEQKITFDTFSYGIKQDCLLAAKDGQGAKACLQEMIDAGLEPNSGHYGRAIMALPFEEAKAFVQKIKEEKPEMVDGKFLSGLIYCLAFNKQFDQIESTFNSIPEVYHYPIDDTLAASYLTTMVRYDLFVGLATYLQLRRQKLRISTNVAAEVLNELIRGNKIDKEKLPRIVLDALEHDKKLPREFLPSLDGIAKNLLLMKLEKASKSEALAK